MKIMSDTYTGKRCYYLWSEKEHAWIHYKVLFNRLIKRFKK